MKIVQMVLILLVFIIINSCGGSGNSSTSTSSELVCESDQYCLAFLTTSTNNADVDANSNGNGIEEADTFCNADGNKPNSRTYKALLVDGTNRTACTTANCGTGGASEHTDWVFQASTQYRRGDGTTIIGTTDSNGIFSFNLTNSIGTIFHSVWGGINSNWTTATDTCSSWSVITGSGQTGLGDSATTLAIDHLTTNCNFSGRFYCVEQPE
jgi:hypothetical protein